MQKRVYYGQFVNKYIAPQLAAVVALPVGTKPRHDFVRISRKDYRAFRNRTDVVALPSKTTRNKAA